MDSNVVVNEDIEIFHRPQPIDHFVVLIIVSKFLNSLCRRSLFPVASEVYQSLQFI